jgi:two-component system cell cycle response regulator
VIASRTTQGDERRSRRRRRLVSGVAFGVLGFSLLASLRRCHVLSKRTRQLEVLARADDLTGMYNRRHVEEHLARALSSARRHRQALSILFVDIDGFKRVNDQFGHQVGDGILKMVAQRIRFSLRSEDVVGRWGGEEFLTVLPMTPLSGALAVAERLRSSIAKTPMKADRHAVRVTVSIGCAENQGDSVGDLLRKADVALYRAKQGGRNRVGALEETDLREAKEPPVVQEHGAPGADSA